MPQTICHYCGGKGWYQAIGEEICGTCHGTCRDFNSDLWSEPCRKCNGKGRVAYSRRVTCNVCGGSGKLNTW